MQALLGVLFHSLGGAAAGSFYMLYNKVKPALCMVDEF